MSKRDYRINWRYAISEFLIVVLGIIAAFQLDAWKEKQDDHQLLLEYLTDLEVGLKSDSLYYGMAIAYFKNIEDRMDSTKNFLQSGQKNLPLSAKTSLEQFSDWFRIYISNSAFEDLNNSGRLNLIKDKELRYNLISYYQYIDFLKLLDEEHNESLGRMQETLLTRLDFQNDNGLNVPAEDIPLLLNYLDRKHSYMGGYLAHRRTCQSINDTILKQIAVILNADH